MHMATSNRTVYDNYVAMVLSLSVLGGGIKEPGGVEPI